MDVKVLVDGKEISPSSLQLSITTAAVQPPSNPNSPSLPSGILDLRPWKLTLPIQGAKEILQPGLSGYGSSPHFDVVGFTPDLSMPLAVRFRAYCSGDTTSGSKYPRSELREMAFGGGLAAWSSTTGRHSLFVRGAVMVAPPVKPQVVFAQIHDDSDDVIEVLYDGLAGGIDVRFKGDDQKELLVPGYKLGTVFLLGISVDQGNISVLCNGKAQTFSHSGKGLYFKAGCYVQSNTKYDKPDAYGEVDLTALKVSHT